MNDFVDKFVSNISSSAYSFYDDISTNTITIRLKTEFIGCDSIGNQELEKLMKESKQQDTTYAIKRHIAEGVVLQMLASMGITSMDLYKIELVRDVPIEDILKLRVLTDD